MPTNNTENIYSTEFENDPNPIPSSKIGYDNTESGLNATTVQGAIDELDNKIKASDEASEITYDNTDSGLEATSVQGAIDEMAGAFDNYMLMGEEDVSIAVPENSTFNSLFHNNGLFTLIQNVITNLNNDEAIDIRALSISPSFSSYALHPLGKSFWKKGETMDATDYSGVFYNQANPKHTITSAKIAGSNSTIRKLDIADADGAMTLLDMTESTTTITYVTLQVMKYKKGV